MLKKFALGILGFVISASNAFSAPQPLVRDIGVVGLFSHDIFSWDRDIEVNKENGRLDLSTIFDYENGKRIKRGGDPKNSENAPVYAITMQLVDFYEQRLRKTSGSKVEKEARARKDTVILFHKWVRESFTRLTLVSFPKLGLDEDVTNVEQAAMRAMHDILPGKISLIRRFAPIKEFTVTDWKFARLKLNDKELDQEIPSFDGKYAEEYRSISIPFTNRTIDLREIDKEFVEKFSDYDFEAMQTELQSLGSDEISFKGLSFGEDLELMLQKAICSNGNVWMPKVDCI